MAAPKGNKNAVGGKGGGRPSAIKELQDAYWHIDLWEKGMDFEKLERKMKTGKIRSGKDVFAYKCLIGNDKMLKVLADKVLPDKIDGEGLGEGLVALESIFRAIAKK